MPLIDLKAAAARGELQKALRTQARAINQVRIGAIKDTSRETQLEVRGIIARAFGPAGPRLGNTVRRQVYDDGPSRAAAIIYTKFGRRDGDGFKDFFLPFVTGATLKSSRVGGYMFIPAAKSLRGGARGIRSKFFSGPSNIDFNDPSVQVIPIRSGKLAGAYRVVAKQPGPKRATARSKVAGAFSETIGFLILRAKMPRRLDFSGVNPLDKLARNVLIGLSKGGL